LSKYKKLFYTKFNLSFGKPKVDICSTCCDLEKKIAADIDRQENNLQLRLHRKRAEKFYSLLTESRKQRDTLTVAFDMMQNQPLPKINVTEQYYSRQLWLYTLGIVIHSRKQKPGDVRLYTWLETDSGKGSNEITSALHNFLISIKKRVARRGYKRLHLYCDSCAAQNKNASMIAMLLTYVNSKNNPFAEVKVVFPIRGHSYLPPDRVFGRLEKEYRRQDIMETPESYYNIMQRQGRVKKINQEWHVFDYKALADQILRKNVLKTQETRAWLFHKNSEIIKCQTTYSGLEKPYNLVNRRVRNLKGRRPKVCHPESHLSPEKRQDVMKLLSFILLEEKEEEFYAEILERVSTKISRRAKAVEKALMKR